MKQKITLLIALFLLTISNGLKAQTLPCDNSCITGSILENEACGASDNDDCANPEIISCGNIVCGKSYNEGLFGSFDGDYYQFTISEPSTISLVTNSSKSHLVTILDNCIDQNVLAVAINDACIEGTAAVNLEPGTYLVYVFPLFSFTDVWTCDDHVTYSFKISCSSGPSDCTLEVLPAATDPSCGGTGNDGSISLLIINGQPLYNIEWDNGSTDQDLFFLTAGTYCYTVTDGLACTVSDCVTLNAPVCGTPSDVTASAITNTKATISWTGNSCALKYRLQVRKSGTSTWTTYFINAGNTSKLITNLEAGTTYQYRIRSVCSLNGSVLSPFSAVQNFTTTGCSSPGSPSVNILSASEAEVLWNTVSGATKYRIRYRPLGTTSWSLKIVAHPLNSAIISNLTAATTYEYQLITVCGDANNLSNPTAIGTFTTNAFRVDAAAVANVSLYPNPSSGNVAITLSGISSTTATLEVYDVLGKQLSTEQVKLNNGTTTLNRDYSKLSEGVYIIRINYNDISNNFKFVKN